MADRALAHARQGGCDQRLGAAAVDSRRHAPLRRRKWTATVLLLAFAARGAELYGAAALHNAVSDAADGTALLLLGDSTQREMFDATIVPRCANAAELPLPGVGHPRRNVAAFLSCAGPGAPEGARPGLAPFAAVGFLVHWGVADAGPYHSQWHNKVLSPDFPGQNASASAGGLNSTRTIEAVHDFFLNATRPLAARVVTVFLSNFWDVLRRATHRRDQELDAWRGEQLDAYARVLSMLQAQSRARNGESLVWAATCHLPAASTNVLALVSLMNGVARVAAAQRAARVLDYESLFYAAASSDDYLKVGDDRHQDARASARMFALMIDELAAAGALSAAAVSAATAPVASALRAAESTADSRAADIAPEEAQIGTAGAAPPAAPHDGALSGAAAPAG